MRSWRAELPRLHNWCAGLSLGEGRNERQRARVEPGHPGHVWTREDSHGAAPRSSNAPPPTSPRHSVKTRPSRVHEGVDVTSLSVLLDMGERPRWQRRPATPEPCHPTLPPFSSWPSAMAASRTSPWRCPM